MKCNYDFTQQGLTKLIDCKESAFFIPPGPKGDENSKFKVVFASTGKLKNNKWVKLYRFELVAFKIKKPMTEP